MNDLTSFHIAIDDRGVLTATLNVPDRPVNVFDDSVLNELHQIVEHVKENAAGGGESQRIKFVVFRSSKPTGFLAGADIHRLHNIQDREEAEWILEQGQKLFNAIEQLPVPTVAVIHGACMGGGLEFALACTYRLAVNDASTKLALPEVKLGLLPAWGGTQRLPKRVGLMESLSMILEGKTASAKKAKKLQLVDELISAPDAEEEIGAFIDARLQQSAAPQRSKTLVQWFLEGTGVGRRFVLSQARKKTARHAKQYPALTKIIDAIEAGLTSEQVSEEGLRAERDGFSELLFGAVAPNLIGLFLDQERAKKASTWTDQADGIPVQKVTVLGAGTMGAGIAQLAASRGYDVILQDVKEEFVERGMKTIRSLFEKAVSKGAMSQADADQSLARLKSRVDWGNSDDVDLMIEAVVENLEVKKAIFRKADELLPMHAVLASNTSALPIDEMGAATKRPEKVAGLHFFNPVHKMPLVEVVKTESSSPETIATLVGVAKKLGKVPVVVRQSPGFLVNRILFPYLDEAARLVVEGYAIAEIDKEAKKFGMPLGPLELLDVVGIDVARDVSKTLSPLSQQETPTPQLFARMVDQGHLGQKSGKGFYTWKDGKRVAPAEVPGVENKTPPQPLPDWRVAGETFGTIQQRLGLAMIREAQACLVEQIVPEAWMIDLGMVLGTGFAPFRGGPMKCIEYWGAENVRQRLQLMEEQLGPRFRPREAAPAVERQELRVER